jgi:cytidyltransferase-like protein
MSKDTQSKIITYSFVIADLFHYGHLKLLKTAKEKGDYHICGLITDEVCHAWQGSQICNFDERKAVLESLNCVDEVISQGSMDPTENLKKIYQRFPRAKIVLIHGNNWKEIPGSDFINEIGGEIFLPEYYAKLSRDQIVGQFRKELEKNVLGYENYTHHFRVGNISHFENKDKKQLISTKANTLKNFKNILTKSFIEELFIFNVQSFYDQPLEVVRRLRNFFNNDKVIVRSSSNSEDLLESSLAGAFKSVLNVDLKIDDDVLSAITEVIESYKAKNIEFLNEQILVQRQSINIIKSGVVFTRNIKTNTPYYAIEYDCSGSTDNVTSGSHSECVYLLRNQDIVEYSKDWTNLILAVREIEQLLPDLVLDIEFGEDREGRIIIFQIRPLAANIRCDQNQDDFIFETIEKFQQKFNLISPENDSLPRFSDMAFWNPSEIIGDNPRPLDYSLYRTVITEKSWNKGLIDLGYTEVSKELMYRFGNKPYIDLEHAFMALTPSKLSIEIKKNLIHYYKSKLNLDITSHDKIEFEIVFDSYNLNLLESLELLQNSYFSRSEINQIYSELVSLTQNIIKNYSIQKLHDHKELEDLELVREDCLKKFKNQKALSTVELYSLFDKLINAINTNGTPQFSKIARQAFIAKSILISFVKKHKLTELEMNLFLESIETVASEFNEDFYRFMNGDIVESEFHKKYGHLRAGTYDIRTPTYSKMTFSPNFARLIKKKKNYCLVEIHKKIQSILLEDECFKNIQLNDFIFFCKDSIKERERYKFIFTKSLSLALEILTEIGRKINLTVNDLSYLEFPALEMAKSLLSEEELFEVWKCYIVQRKNIFNNFSQIPLPPILKSSIDFKHVFHFSDRPNFVTLKKVSGKVVYVEDMLQQDLENKIILIKKADPGYDWIFTHKILGLVTQYGGAASHMAIRCAEFNIPAAIGCGEKKFNEISQSFMITIDCEQKKLFRYSNK